eukprot:CCRYP_016174-RA/>CCRYP_016174-RA protein AED:0.49 eAED:0.82 QI:0/-1/0/1/-1/0/1/0/16
MLIIQQKHIQTSTMNQ